ncbi:acetoacetate-CoA ligase [Fonsecaea erecta]|uniref:Acetoacetate-CoA ligase n=1 Tax=Fonsecaea erecta TaxID=1367422 RepID=A0A178Z4T1_9EURO|nr:acetoacetate-CoA ligase [Fonsecaea erecta]OAP54486.1 acetoacetate-CoA ligase [Fonsecaea erecta]
MSASRANKIFPIQNGPRDEFETRTKPLSPIWKPKAPASQIPMNIYREHVNKKFFLRLTGSHDLHRWSVTDPQAFWVDLWDYVGLIPGLPPGIKQAYDPNIPISEVPPFFEGASINYAENVLIQPLVDDRSPALIGLREGQHLDGEVWTWSILRENVRRVRSALLRSGIRKGDRVAALISTSVWSVALLLGSASIAAIFTSIAPDLGLEGCTSRLQQVQPSILFADSHCTYKGKQSSNTPKIAAILKLLKPNPELFVVPTGPEEDFQLLSDFLRRSKDADELKFDRLPLTTPLYILYSSGTSGPPKCLVHSHAAIIQHKKIGKLHNSLKPGEVVFQYSSTSWVLWNIMVGHLAMGATLVLYDGSPTWPRPQRMLEIVERFKVNYWGASPKYLKELESTGVKPKADYDLSNLRMVQTGGSHLASDQYHWFYNVFPSSVHLTSVTGGTDLVTSWCGTDPAGPLFPGEIQMPILGHDVDIADPIDGHSIKDTGEAGEFVCRKPFPSMPVYMWGDTEGKKYKASDGVLNPQGIRFGSAEIYSITEAAPFLNTVATTLCVGRKRQGLDFDESVFLFVVMRAGCPFTKKLEQLLKDAIRKSLSPRHVPRFVVEVRAIPMTSNGKKVETLVKEVISTGEMPRTISSTVINPECIEAFRHFYLLEAQIKCDFSSSHQPCTNCRLGGLLCKPHQRKRPRYLSTGDPSSQGQEAIAEHHGDEDSTPVKIRSSEPVAVPDDQAQTLIHQAGRQWQTEGIEAMTVIGTRNELTGSPEYVAATESHVGRSDYIGSGDIRFREEMVKVQSDTLRISQTDSELLQLQKAFELPQRSVLASLVDSYFEYCSPWTPVLEFSDVAELQARGTSPLLLNAVLLAGSRVASSDILSASAEDFYRKARLIFILGHERDALTCTIAVTLLQWFNPTGPEHISTSTSGFWVRIAAGLAYQIGLHKERTTQKNTCLRRRLWWSIVCRDDIISIGTGRPRTINLDDSDVANLCISDFPTPDTNARLFIAFSGIIRLLADLTENIRRKTMTAKIQVSLENALYRWIKSLPVEFHLFYGSPKMLGSYNFHGRQLLVPYFVFLFILSRHSASRKQSIRMSLITSSFVAGMFEDFLNRGELCHCGPVFTFYAFAAGLAQVLALRYKFLTESAEDSLFIIQSSLTELKKRWGSAEGALAALGEIKRLTLRSPSLGDVPDHDVGRLAPFVEDFGPQLCKQYQLLAQDCSATGALPPLHSNSASISIGCDYHPSDTQDGEAEHIDPPLGGQSISFFGDMDPFGSWIDDLELGLMDY